MQQPDQKELFEVLEKQKQNQLYEHFQLVK